jgi:hypothetical protein
MITGGKDDISNNHFYFGDTNIILNGDKNTVRNNYFSGTIRIDLSGMGSDNIVEGNRIFVTENSGTTSAGTSIDVAHGLSGAPDQVIATPLGQTEYHYVTNIGTTNFTIISESSVAFNWYAVYKP